VRSCSSVVSSRTAWPTVAIAWEQAVVDVELVLDLLVVIIFSALAISWTWKRMVSRLSKVR